MKKFTFLVAFYCVSNTILAQPVFTFEDEGVSTGVAMTDFTFADMNNDGRIDAIGASSNSGMACINLSKAAGGFNNASSYTGLSNGQYLAVTDYNNDGLKDVFISGIGATNTSASRIVILNGSASGLMAPLTVTLGPAGYRQLRVADVNNDGKKDLIAGEVFSAIIGAGVSRISVFGLPGNGTLLQPVHYPLTYAPTEFIMSDLNTDGLMDVVASSYVSNKAIILLNTGSGFGTAQYINVATNPVGVCTGDFDNDGKIDIVVGSTNLAFSVLTGDGNGNFNVLGTFTTSTTSDYPTAADFNADGKLDIAFGSDDLLPGVGVEVLAGNGDGTFTFASPQFFPTLTNKLEPLDFNFDGKMDLVGFDDNNALVLIKNTTTTTVSTVGLSKVDKDNSVVIIQNKQVLQIASEKDCTVQLVDITGKVVLSLAKDRKFQLSTTELAQGIYTAVFVFDEHAESKRIFINKEL